jgi:hypothetical protein
MFTKGRHFVYYLLGFTGFWGRHRDDLAGLLAPEVVTAIDTIVAAVPTIVTTLNPRGPG